MKPNVQVGSPMKLKRKKPSLKDQKQTIKRLLTYISKDYKIPFICVLICILISSVAGVMGSMFLQVLIDDYITPLVASEHPVFAGLLKAIMGMMLIYIVGVIAGYFYNRTMVIIAQGVLRDIRNEMFYHMQKLPIKYFDTHTHGDMMSRYTNDTDTLRQMIAQSLPQMFSSMITIVAVFFAMVATSVYLTAFVMVIVFCMLQITKKVAGKSGSYFIQQQIALGKTNGYIEEMINGQKVVKVFCYEEEA